MQFSVKVIIAAFAIVGLADAKPSSLRRSLRTGNAGTSGNTALFGFVDTFAEADADDDGFGDAETDFGTDDVSAGSNNFASVDPAGAPDSASGSTFAALDFGADVDVFAGADDDAEATASAGGAGGIVSFYDSGAASVITPTMVIPGTVTNATVMTKGTKGTKATGGDDGAAAVPGVEMVGAAIGSQGVNATAAIFGEAEVDTGSDSFAEADTFSFFDAFGNATQVSTSAAGPTQDGASGLNIESFGILDVEGADYGEAFANGTLNVTGSTIGSGFAVFDNTTAVP